LLARADIGNVTYKMRDVTNTAYFTGITNPTYDGEGIVLMERWDTAPAGCEEAQPEIALTGASDDVYASAIFGPYFAGATRFKLPSTVDEGWKLRLIRPARYDVSISDGVREAQSQEFEGDLLLSVHYSTEHLYQDANPNQVLLEPGVKLEQQPYWLALERPEFDISPLSSEAAVSYIPLNVSMPYFIHETLKALSTLPGGAGDPSIGRLLVEYEGLTAALTVNTPRQRRHVPRNTFVVRA